MSDSGDPKQDMAHLREQRDDYLERIESEREVETCCQGRNINCGHHWGRSIIA